MTQEVVTITARGTRPTKPTELTIEQLPGDKVKITMLAPPPGSLEYERIKAAQILAISRALMMPSRYLPQGKS
jgi:hypothetical protein